MFEFLKGILDILRDLLPSKDQPTHVWASRLLILLLSGLGSFYILFFTFKDTPLGEKYGINSNKIILPTLIEYAYSNRSVLNLLSEYKSQNIANVANIFLVALYNKRTNDFVVREGGSNPDLLIWGWSVPVQKFSNIENTDFLLNQNKELFLKTLKSESSHCITDEIPLNIRSQLRNIYLNEASNYYTMCPIRDRSDKVLIAFTIAFVKVADEMEANFYAYKQNTTTIEVSRRFSKFTIPFVINRRSD